MNSKFDHRASSSVAALFPDIFTVAAEALSRRVTTNLVDQPQTGDAHARRKAMPDAPIPQEVRDWMDAHRVVRPAANDESPLETHKKMWLELLT